MNMLILASDFPLIVPTSQLFLGFPSPKLCIHFLYSHLNIFLCYLSSIYCNLYKYKFPYFVMSWISYLCVNLSLFRFRTLSVDVMSDIFSKVARPGACLYQCWGIKATWH